MIFSEVFSTLQSRVRPLFFSIAAVIVVLCSSVAGAQLSGKGAITGTIYDSTGAAIPGAAVTAKNTTNGVVTKTTSTSAGDYSFSALDPGIYTVTVTMNGFKTLTQQDVHVNALESQTYSPKLSVGSEGDSVTVTTQPPALETANATQGATIENDMYSALPIEMGAYGQPDQRRATDFAFLMPGVQGNNTSGNPTTNTGIINGSGSKGAVSDVYVDGVAFVRAGGNGDPRYVWTAISVDAVDQFQLQTSGYSAQYEGQGIQNYTIKEGGNKFHGSVYEFFRNTALDTWGFFGANVVNPATGKSVKPIENSNEYGINLSGPLVPFGTWRDKLFFFGNYSGFRYASSTPTAITFPNTAEQQGNFAGVISGGIFDPTTEASCAAHNTGGKPCRYRYGYGPGTGVGASGNPVLTPGGAVDQIPTAQFSTIAKQMQSYIPALSNQALNNNYNAANKTGLSNWSMTDRIDYIVGSKDTITMIAALGRQASSNPVGQTTAGRNVGPVPYNYGQAYAPKTAVGIIEETHVFTPHLVNQFKYGYARYNGPTFLSNQTPTYAATAQGLTGLPGGQAANAFPIVTFSGTNAPTNWGGTTANRTLAQNYTVVDNLQYVIGKHSIVVGNQIAWLLYSTTSATNGSTPLTLANAVTETSQLNNAFSALSNTGASYASFLIGEVDKGSLTQYLVQEYGARFRAISPYVQDTWKATNKLTVDFGIRYDYFPTYHEVEDNQSFFSPTTVNPITGANGALVFSGTGANTCYCQKVVNNWFKNVGPRLGVAYQLDPKTVLRASYGLFFTHGNGVGGGASSGTGTGTLGFSAAPSFAANGSLLSTMPIGPIGLTGNLGAQNSAFPAYASAAGRASGPAYGTGYTNTAGYTGTPSTMGYADPYLGGRAPEFINWSFGFEHQWTQAITTNITYVGSEGHFLVSDGSNARGYWANTLDPKYLYLGSALSNTGTTSTTLTQTCAANNLTCPANFNTGQSLATALKPFPFQGVSDTFGNVSNSFYNSLQAQLNMRPTHGLTFMVSYTWSRSIDDGGTFRSGYAIPAAYSNNGRSWAADAIERTISTTNQPQHIVVTGAWALPFGKQMLNSNRMERALLGGFKFSEIFQAYSGSPLPIIGASCNTNPAQITCMPNYNPAFTGPARINGKWGQGITRTNYNSTSNAGSYFIDRTAFAVAPAYTFGNISRTAPYNIYGPGNYQLDIALVRSFPLHFTESSSFDFRAEMYNVTNHTQFSPASNSWSSSATSFGQVAGSQANKPRQVQFSARVNF